MSPTLPVPSASSTAEAPKPKPSPPSAESLCLKTFRACWYLNKDWLVSFVASTQRVRPDAPITWVKFMPKGHTHLVRSALKLVPISKHLPLAKIKEVMFTFILETLNAPSTSPGFFNARKAAKPRKRTHKCKSGKKQPVDSMAVDTPLTDPNPPPPSTGNPSGSTPVPSTGAGNEGDKGKVPPGPSSEAPGTRGADPVTPHTSLFPDPATPPPKTAEDALEAFLQRSDARTAQLSAATTCAPSPSPSITSVLGKRSFPPPPLHPRPRSVPPSHMPRRTGAHGWSGSARPTRNATRAIQCRQSSRPWTFATWPQPLAPPPLLPPLPSLRFPPLLPPPLLPFCRRPPEGRNRSLVSHQLEGR